MATAKDIFLRAIELESKDERQRYVDEACSSNDDLRSQVVKLLDEFDAPDSRFSRPAARFDFTVTADGGNGGAGLSDSSSHHGRFLPGTKLADRYRIVSLLGRGGMGEVYRADDLRLGQTVALKFLPPELAKDAKRLEYFHNEVRLARQISHPNICRVYDIGEVDGQHFISMEYIDGEDLKTLLHRIGRLPKDKGNQISQQLCSGLAAAHAKGVLHRDLKPANIMIDGQGQARITDFGLATVSSDGESVIGMSGTPAYMAPEQLLRGETSVESDIYSLGLVLFEMFAGRSAHRAENLGELRRLHEENSSIAQLSDVIEDCDPIIDRIVRRCLEPDPVDRPKNVRDLASALPGGDPLTAVLQAGELPSADLVAESVGEQVFNSTKYSLLGIAGLLALCAIPWAGTRANFVSKQPAERSADVLEADAKRIVAKLGYSEPPEDWACGFDSRREQSRQRRQWLNHSGPDGPRAAVGFWYRQHEGRLFTNATWVDFAELGRGRVSDTEPPWFEPGMIGVWLNRRGQLKKFQAIAPIELDANSNNSLSQFDWCELLPEDTLGFALEGLRPSNQRRTPPCVCDTTSAWEGVWPGTSDDLFVQAGSFRGRPVYFEVFLSDVASQTGRPSVRGGFPKSPVFVLSLVSLLLVAVGIVVGIRNIVGGRIDRRGSVRITIGVFILEIVGGGLFAHHIPHPYFEGLVLVNITLAALFTSVVCGLQYVAIEPLARRLWPQLLVSWTRLLRGRLRDPLVGRDVFLGIFVAALVILLSLCFCTANDTMLVHDPALFMGAKLRLGWSLIEVARSIRLSLGILLMLAVFRYVTKSRWLAVAATALFCAAGIQVTLMLPRSAILAPVLIAATTVFLLARFGFLFYVTYLVTGNLLAIPFTTDLSAFYAETGYVHLASAALVAALSLATAIRKLRRQVAWR